MQVKYFKQMRCSPYKQLKTTKQGQQVNRIESLYKQLFSCEASQAQINNVSHHRIRRKKK